MRDASPFCVIMVEKDKESVDESIYEIFSIDCFLSAGFAYLRVFADAGALYWQQGDG